MTAIDIAGSGPNDIWVLRIFNSRPDGNMSLFIGMATSEPRCPFPPIRPSSFESGHHRRMRYGRSGMRLCFGCGIEAAHAPAHASND